MRACERGEVKAKSSRCVTLKSGGLPLCQERALRASRGLMMDENSMANQQSRVEEDGMDGIPCNIPVGDPVGHEIFFI